jgi:hypothetical protein
MTNNKRPQILAKAAAVVAGAAIAIIAAGSPQNAEAASRTLVVDGASKVARCSDATPKAAVSAARPLCTIAKAATLVAPGDTVQVRAATYRGTLAPRISGTAKAPIHFHGVERGVVLAANGAAAGINLDGVHDLRFTGFTVTGATQKGVWVGRSARVTFTKLTVKANRAPGIVVKATSSINVDLSNVSNNKGGGILELGGVVAGHYTRNVIAGNGHDHKAFNGDGIILQGRGAIVRGNRISGNGDNALYEHGIYASHAAVAYLVERNVIGGNSATGVKAMGSGQVRGNNFGSSRFGVYVDTHSLVKVYGNTFKGSFAKTVASKAGSRFQAWGNRAV